MDFRESLCGSLRIVCGKPTESSLGIRGIVFRESAELSFVRPWIRLMGVLRTIFGRLQVIEFAKLSSGVLKLACNRLRTFRSNPSVEHSAGMYGGSTDTSNGSAYNLRRMVHGSLQTAPWNFAETYTANLQNF